MKFENKIGSDETGVGDYFGPLIAVSAYIPKENWDKVKALGIDDSKKINDKRIVELYFKLKELVIWKQGKLTPKGYNKLNSSFNAHELKTIVHLKAMTELEKEVNAKEIILDQYVNERKFGEYIRKLEKSSLGINGTKLRIHMETKAESKYLEVAVASIIARAILLFEMKKMGELYKTTFPLGASFKVDNFGKQFVKKHGSQILKDVAKYSFATTKKIAGGHND